MSCTVIVSSKSAIIRYDICITSSKFRYGSFAGHEVTPFVTNVGVNVSSKVGDDVSMGTIGARVVGLVDGLSVLTTGASVIIVLDAEGAVVLPSSEATVGEFVLLLTTDGEAVPLIDTGDDVLDNDVGSKVPIVVGDEVPLIDTGEDVVFDNIEGLGVLIFGALVTVDGDGAVLLPSVVITGVGLLLLLLSTTGEEVTRVSFPTTTTGEAVTVSLSPTTGLIEGK